MNQQCKVCNEPAAGFHFGAFTCEGCKSFFGRTYNNLSSISECKNNGECVINKKNRTSCKACRLRKCLQVGMSKSGSRYGRRSNWFKIHCLLQEQSSSGANSNQALLGSNGTGLYPGLIPGHFLTSDNFLQARLSGFPPQYGHQKSESKKDDNRHSSTDDSGGSSMEDVEEDASSRSASALSFMRPPSSHKTPSPFSEKDSLSIKTVRPTAMLPMSPLGIATHHPFPSPLNAGLLSLPYLRPFPATLPGLTPAPMAAALGDHVPPIDFHHRMTGGGDLNLYSPAPGGMPVEQLEPIDLSVKSSSASTPALSPPRASPSPNFQLDGEIDPPREGRTTPLDLTKRSPQLCMELPRESYVS